MRLDKYLVEEGYFESRNRALDAIKTGKVTVDGKKAKASMQITPDTQVEVEDEKFYVSRAARKLESFLKAYPMALKGKRALDIGSSTGGFAQILLENGVGSLTCVDVGSDQLHVSLKQDSRLSLHEETDIRNFEDDKGFEVVTCDVSFISVLQIIDAIDRLSMHDIIILYKPQFEVGREVKRDSRGVVQDSDAIRKRKEEFEAHVKSLGWELKYESASSVAGKSGNQEYLFHFVKIKN
ncbi:TlyA family RNA methyltransferase [Sulfurovum sp.]|jgi:23S rRNA (cytidine1920-2'-O)/16S rRNA (cytidine1409-2'-O)-methyltransferase|uniref:23S rRNA (cytidine-2'-O)-methyltransferase TlyA n=1 Tax=Sulfurovum sp. TaxID=1969726 RepID=UPI002A361292|nr:TlyA family RNA methyltransferase [Sulfurovum sp.]MDD2450588.1 TlyA family RNA methyltransferase [Sulfurovum sp.]MDD3499027.1 TlyA family RNA methyltransferase [Sulfurovum sp.]MDY0403195.1 TlyA family RNA methyltransferase [Sulfurovum sp.]